MRNDSQVTKSQRRTVFCLQVWMVPGPQAFYNIQLRIVTSKTRKQLLYELPALQRNSEFRYPKNTGGYFGKTAMRTT